MTKKELEIELNKLKEEIRILKGEKDNVTFEEIEVGETFYYKNLKFVKLSDKLSLMTPTDRIYCLFDNVDSDYKKSLIRYYINNRLCEDLGIDKDDLEYVNEWGDKLTLLSEYEYNKFKTFINIDYWWWTRSASSAISTKIISLDGHLSYYHVYDAYGGVCPALIFKSSIFVRKEMMKSE